MSSRTRLAPFDGRRRPVSNRRGLGIVLVLVAVLTLVLSTLGIARFAASETAASEVQRQLRADLAMLAAESAVEEMLARFRTAARDRGSPVFDALRQEVYAGSPGDLTLEQLARVPALREHLGIREWSGVEIEDVAAEVLFQRQLEDLPYEKHGQVAFRARASASLGLGRRVSREIVAVRELRVVLATVPRPFDQTALFVTDAHSVTDFARVNRLRRRYLESVEELRRLLGMAAELASGETRGRLEAALQAVPSAAALADRVPELPESRPMALYAVGEEQQRLPLDMLDLESDLLAAEDRTRASRQEARDAVERSRRDPSNDAVRDEVLPALERALGGAQEMLDRIWTYGEVFQFLTPDDERWAAVDAERARLGEDHWRRVASYVLKDSEERTASEALADLRRRLGALSGVVLIDEPAAPVVLEGAWPGKLVVAVKGGSVILRDTNGGATGDSLLTVVGLGTSVSVEGRVEASLVLAGAGRPDLRFSEGAALEGSLIAGELPPDRARTGTVVCREKFRSGVTTESSSELASLDHYVVTVAPGAAFARRSRR